MLIIKTVLHYSHLLLSFIYVVVTPANAQNIPDFLRFPFDVGRRFQPQHVVNSALDVSRGLFLTAQQAPIPTPAQLFDIGINLLVGYPIEQVFSAINAFCKSLLDGICR